MIDAMDLEFDRCYQATRSRDPRFDGWFIVGVRTTGIYCRPSCPSPVCPKPVNVTFYRTAAAAQLAGLRACKRCRPDAVAGSPEWNTRADVVGRAMRLIADGVVDREGVPGLARQLAVSVRQLHRVLVEAVGAPPLALARSQRAYQARLLVETTAMPLGEVAFAAGFASIRQFNETLREIFDATPSQLRAAVRRRTGDPHPRADLTLRLAVRPPYDPRSVVEWLAVRALPGIEEYADGTYRRVLRLPGGPGTVTLRPAPDHVLATLRLATVADLGAAVARCRRLLDLDADPAGYLSVLAADPALAPLTEAVPGLRLPGTVDGAETALRAVLGAHAPAVVAALAEPLPSPDGGLTHAFPEPAAIAAADLALPAATALTVRALARQLATGELRLDQGADRVAVRRGLLAVPGLGPGRIEDVMLHALGDPDAFPATDRGLRATAKAHGLPADPAGLARRADRWRPWRGYAAHLLWRQSRPGATRR